LTLTFATISDDEPNVPTVPVAAIESFHAHMVDGIEKQKRRAIKLLNECNLRSQYPATKLAEVENLKEDILKDLEMGLVPPAYHALVRGYDPFGSRTSVPSGKSVKAGKNIEDGNPCPHFDRYEENFFDTFVTNDKAYKQVRDEDLHPYIWKYNATAATSIERLVNTKAKMVGEDLEITENLLSVFDIETSKSVSTTFLTRCESRGVVANCFIADEPSLSLAITGSPGIGKSWTLLYVLQQALLYENACVLFFNQKVKEALLCIRKGDMVCAWMCSTHDRAFSSLFPRENVLVLLDLHESRMGGADFYNGSRKLIYAASNNVAHFKNDSDKTHYPERFLSPWAREELKIALPIMKPGIKMDEVWEKARVVGMLPRYFIKEEGVYKGRKAKLVATF
jgi:hypothetical protein